LIQKVKHITLLVVGILFYSINYGQLYNQELDGYDPATTRKDKLGIRVGFGVTTLSSDALVNTRASRGYQGAFYYRVNLFKGFHLNAESGASVKGANFNNGDSGYSQLSLLYLDVGVLGMFQLTSDNKHNLIVGVQSSRLMRSSLFVGPEQFASFLQLPIKKWDHAAVVGYHFNTQFVGFQLALKYGLRNIAGDFFNFNKVSVNNSSQFVDLDPSMRNLSNLRNISVELSVYF
jgi:hypothetical protein